ncbi:MAG: FAD-dependent oxidoreductase, partial [Candidatus Omnitrophica bacterium]|nr:FAD-dependent oxidoreductase [Candidatus Omnitrophota bacterium]
MKDKKFDIIIIGGGPAGFAAGIYAARSRMITLVIESLSIMGQATMTEVIENYPGIEKMTGIDLVFAMKRQAESFGTKFTQGTVKKLFLRTDSGKKFWRVEDENGVYEAQAVIVASGAHSKQLDVPGEKELIGKGVSYCATCDGAFFKEKNIVVVGGGDAAVEEALYLTRFGKRVTLIHRRDKLRAAKIYQERFFANNKTEFIGENIVEGIIGKDKVEGVAVKNLKTGEKGSVSCDGVFIFVGWEPNTDFLKGIIRLDQK